MALTRAEKLNRREERKSRRVVSRRLAAKAQVGRELTGLAGEEIEFVAAGEGADATQPKKFRMVAYTGGRMRPMGFPHDVIVDLSGVKIQSGARPSYLEHDRQRIVGHIEKVDTTGGKIVAEGIVSGAGPAADEVLASSAKGFPWRSSIGGAIDQIVFVEAGEAAPANGQNWRGPCYIVRKLLLTEISFVSLAGDNLASAKITASERLSPNSLSRGSTMNFSQWLTAKGFVEADLTTAQLAFLQAAFEADQELAASEAEDKVSGQKEAKPNKLAASAGNPANGQELMANGRQPSIADQVGELRAAFALETTRVTKIREIAAQYGVSKIKLDGKEVDLVAHAIEQNLSAAETELHALRAARPQAGPAIHAGGSGVTGEALEAALCLTAGLGEKVAAQGVSDKAMEAALGRELRGSRLSAVFHQTIRAAGKYAPAGKIDGDFIRAGFEADQMLRASGAATISLTGILGNVANKVLLKSFGGIADIVDKIAGVTSHSDFKGRTSYRLNGDATFLEVGPDGELKSFEVGEESYTNALKTYGRIIQLTRQMIINDDLGAFLQLPTVLGRGAALALLKVLFTMLNGNTGTFFSTGNKNNLTGAGSAFDYDALKAAWETFLKFEDADGNPISVEPKTLLVPPGVAMAAKQLMGSAYFNETTTANKGKGQVNPMAGMFSVETSPWLAKTSVSGSATAWYLLADPADLPAIEVAFLDGNRTPRLESSEADFDTLGMKWRSFWDFGVAFQNKQGAVRSVGA